MSNFSELYHSLAQQHVLDFHLLGVMMVGRTHIAMASSKKHRQRSFAIITLSVTLGSSLGNCKSSKNHLNPIFSSNQFHICNSWLPRKTHLLRQPSKCVYCSDLLIDAYECNWLDGIVVL